MKLLFSPNFLIEGFKKILDVASKISSMKKVNCNFNPIDYIHPKVVTDVGTDLGTLFALSCEYSMQKIE